MYTEIATSQKNFGVKRDSDGAFIPSDPNNLDWRMYQAWLAQGHQPTPAPPTPFVASAVANECQRRIYAVASQNCQMNMTAFVANGGASDADKAAFSKALQWVQDMRAACLSLIGAQDATSAQDAHWPTCPAEVLSFVARF